jgi:hypothetical protein
MKVDPRIFPPRPPLQGESELSAGVDANYGDDRRWNFLHAKVTAPAGGSNVDGTLDDLDRVRRIFGEQCLAHNNDLSAGILTAAAEIGSSVVMATPEICGGVSLDDFYAHMPTHQYIFMPTREPWPASSVDSRLKRVTVLGGDGKPMLNNVGKKISVRASDWLDQNKPVEQMTWAPGFPK